MFPRLVALIGSVCVAAPALFAQDSVVNSLSPEAVAPIENVTVESAWIDLRQVAPTNSKAQTAPAWVESVAIVPPEKQSDAAAKTVFRIRVSRPADDLHVLMLRLFFDDLAQRQPKLIAWDETGNTVVESRVLGSGVGLPISETVMVPMTNASAIDIEVPGDGTTIRGAFLDWMAEAQVLHPLGAEQRQLIPEPFAASAPLHARPQDVEQFGTVTATLADETILIGASVQNGAAFQFGLESQPLVALLTFEVGSPNIDAPPEVFVNGESLGPVALLLPDLADPAYRGEMGALVHDMRFQYTGWVRAQKLVPISSLHVGTNDVLVVGGSGTASSAIRATQIQLKYNWDKLDYRLVPERPSDSR